MGRTCQICGDIRPNEQFGRRGQRARTCSKCRRLPRDVRRSILLRDEVAGFLDQSNISKKNIKRPTLLEADKDPEVAKLASIVNQIALIKPGRRKRWKRLWYGHRHLVHAASEAGFVDWAFPVERPVDDDYEWPSELDFLEDDLLPENCFGVWITPRPDEREPRFSDLLRSKM